jgi:hypothetical protein
LGDEASVEEITAILPELHLFSAIFWHCGLHWFTLKSHTCSIGFNHLLLLKLSYDARKLSKSRSQKNRQMPFSGASLGAS